MTYRPIICIDFDGVIHRYTSGWQGVGVIKDAPVSGAMRWIAENAYREDVQIAISSSRSKNLFGRWAMKRWLRIHLGIFYAGHLRGEGPNLPGEEMMVPWTGLDAIDQGHEWARHTIRKIKWPWFKPAAFVSIDDRAITFNGTFPPVDKILTFRPWNKQ